MSADAKRLTALRNLVNGLDHLAMESYRKEELHGTGLYLKADSNGIIHVYENDDSVPFAEVSWETNHYEVRVFA